MQTDEPYIAIATVMALRLTRVDTPTDSRIKNEAILAGEILYQAEQEGVARWRELRRKKRDQNARNAAPKRPDSDGAL